MEIVTQHVYRCILGWVDCITGVGSTWVLKMAIADFKPILQIDSSRTRKSWGSIITKLSSPSVYAIMHHGFTSKFQLFCEVWWKTH